MEGIESNYSPDLSLDGVDTNKPNINDLLGKSLEDNVISKEEASNILGSLGLEKGKITNESKSLWKELSNEIKEKLEEKDIYSLENLLSSLNEIIDIENKNNEIGKKLNGGSITIPKEKLYNFLNRFDITSGNVYEEIIGIQKSAIFNINQIVQENDSEGTDLPIYFSLTGEYTHSVLENIGEKAYETNYDYDIISKTDHTRNEAILDEDGNYSLIEVTETQTDKESYNNQELYRLIDENLDKAVFQSSYMKDVESIISESDGTLVGFIEGLDKKGYSEQDLLKTLAALSAESFIRAYDREFYNTDGKSLKELYDSASTVLDREVNGDELIGGLKQSITDGSHVDLVTCVQYSSVIAQILEMQGYEVMTGTIDIGIQHRFASLKGKDGNTYIITNGSIYSGKNYDQVYTSYQEDIESLSFYSNNFDSKNNFKSSYQTETMKTYGDIVSANGSLNTQNLVSRISDNGIDNKNKLDIELGNNIKKILFQSIDRNNTGLYVEGMEKRIDNEGTTVQSAKIGGLGAYGDINNMIQMRGGFAYVETEFSNGNRVKNYGISSELTTYNSFNMEGKNPLDGFYGNISTGLALNIGGLMGGKSSGGLPISDLLTTYAGSTKIGYKGDGYNLFVKGGASGEMQNISSMASGSSKGKHIDTGDFVGIGANIGNENKVNAYIESGSYKGETKNKINLGFENNVFTLGLKYKQAVNELAVIDTKESLEVNGGIRIDEYLNGGVLSTFLKTNKIGEEVDNFQGGFKLEFKY